MTTTRAGVLLAAMFAGGCVHVQLPEVRILTGQAQEGLAWDRAVDLARAHHPDLLQYRDRLDAAAHNRNAALGGYLPSVEGSLNRKSSRTSTSTTADSLSLGLDVSQPIFAGFAKTGAALKAWREWEAARWAYVEKSAEVRFDLRSAFVELLRLYKLREANRRLAERRQQNADLIRLRYEAGREHQGSYKRAQAIADQAAFEVRQTERRIDSQSLALGRELGGTFAMPMTVAGDLEQLVPAEPERPVDYVPLAEAAPGVQQLKRSAEALKAAILSSQASLWPTVDGSFAYGYSGTDASDLKDSASLGFTVTVPLFEGGRNIQGVLESNAEYKAAFEAARSARDQRIADLSARWGAFRDAWEFVAVKRDFLEAARQRAEIIHAQYTSGLAGFQDFDIAEQELADSEKAYVQSLADVLIREGDWILAKGATLEEAHNAAR